MAEPYIGEIRPFAFGFAPRGWARCEGQLLAIATNSALFSILGVTYGGDGRTNFKLPDLRGRVPLCFNNNFPLGNAQGEPAHALTVGEMPPHVHQASASSTTATLAAATGNYWAGAMSYSPTASSTMSPNALASAGGSAAHENMQPYTAVSFCIALQGLFPPRN